jgi:hypothetical protein
MALNLAMFSVVKCFQKGGGAGNGALGSGFCWSAMTSCRVGCVTMHSNVSINTKSGGGSSFGAGVVFGVEMRSSGESLSGVGLHLCDHQILQRLKVTRMADMPPYIASRDNERIEQDTTQPMRVGRLANQRAAFAEK